MDVFEAFRNQIKANYGFGDWRRRVEAAAMPLSRGFLPRVQDLGEYELAKRRPLPDMRNAFIDYYRSKKDKEVCFAVTLIEYPTVEQAHEGLVDELQLCMAPSLPRVEEKGIQAGDVGFAGYGDLQTSVVFVRNNVLVKVESVGTKHASVEDLSERLDQQIVAHMRAR